jgi:hypothetical protein
VQERWPDDGFAYLFPSEGPWLARVSALVESERVRRPFFRVEVVLEPSDGRLRPSLRGANGVTRCPKISTLVSNSPSGIEGW